MQAWQATVQDDRGNAVPNPVVTVYLADGVTLATVYNDAGTAIPNPVAGNLDGFVQFYAEPGSYKFQASGGEEWDVTFHGVFSSYADAVAAKDYETGIIEATIGGRKYAWSRQDGGTALGGGWVPAGVATPQHYGATGTGNEDLDQSAVTAAFTANDHVFFPSGRYIFRAVARSGMLIEGEGPSSIIQHPNVTAVAPHFSAGVISAVGRENITIRNLACDGNKANITNPENNTFEMINIKDSFNCKVENIFGYDTWRELVDLDECSDCTITGVTGRNIGGPVVHISDNCERVVAINCVADSCGFEREGGYFAFDFWAGTKDCGFVNCRIINSSKGFRFQGSSNYITDCVVDGAVGEGLRISGERHSIQGLILNGCNTGLVATGVADVFGQAHNIENCSIVGTGQVTDGFRVSGEFGVDGSHRLSMCSVSGLSGRGIFLRATAQNCTIDKCKFDGCANGVSDEGFNNFITRCQSEGSTSNAFRTSGTRARFSKCTALNSGAASFFTGSTSQSAVFEGCLGIGGSDRGMHNFGASTILESFVTTGQAGNAVTDNTITMRATGIGEGSKVGVFTGNGGASFVNIPHGFSGTLPRNVKLTAMSADAGAQRMWVSAIGATNITVTFSGVLPAGTGNVSISWEASL